MKFLPCLDAPITRVKLHSGEEYEVLVQTRTPESPDSRGFICRSSPDEACYIPLDSISVVFYQEEPPDVY